MYKLQQQLETFRENFRYTKLYVWDDMIVYKIPEKHVASVTLEGMELINRLGLDLLIVENDLKSFFADTIRIKSK